MRTHPIFRLLLELTLITGCVLLSFRYILPLVFPFLISYALMRMLLPLIRFAKDRFHFPSWLAYSTVLFLFFAVTGGLLLLLGWLFCRQFQLLLTNLSVYRQIYQDTITACGERFCHCIDYYFNLDAGSTSLFFADRFTALKADSFDRFCMNAGETLLSCVSSSFHLIAALLIIFIGMIVLCKDMNTIHEFYRKSRFYPALHQIGHTIKKTGLSYLRSQFTIISVNWVVCGTGLFLIHNPYSIVLGLIISIFDAFPVLGSGMILIPWGIFYIIKHHFYQAAILFTIYLITVFSRELLEAKLMGHGMGMLPFFMLASIYIGLELFGITGILLGPFAVVLIRSIYEVWSQDNSCSG